MIRCVSAVIVVSLLLAVPVLSEELPQILQPHPTAYTPSELSSLMQAIENLQETLDDYTLGSRKAFTPDGWQSQDFAAYTAGTLAEMGYETKIVSAPGWPEGVHTWVIVGIPLNGKTAWIPVEASPEIDHTQQTLGKVPVITDPAGGKGFDPRYVSFTDIVDLPPNLPPVARIRLPNMKVAIVGGMIRVFSLESYDPDGEIVLYQWNFGDGETAVTTSWSASHRFKTKGEYTLAVTVIDNRGSRATASTVLTVIDEGSETKGSSGCGCGG